MIGIAKERDAQGAISFLYSTNSYKEIAFPSGIVEAFLFLWISFCAVGRTMGRGINDIIASKQAQQIRFYPLVVLYLKQCFLVHSFSSVLCCLKPLRLDRVTSFRKKKVLTSLVPELWLSIVYFWSRGLFYL